MTPDKTRLKLCCLLQPGLGLCDRCQGLESRAEDELRAEDEPRAPAPKQRKISVGSVGTKAISRCFQQPPNDFLPQWNEDFRVKVFNYQTDIRRYGRFRYATMKAQMKNAHAAYAQSKALSPIEDVNMSRIPEEVD